MSKQKGFKIDGEIKKGYVWCWVYPTVNYISHMGKVEGEDVWLYFDNLEEMEYLRRWDRKGIKIFKVNRKIKAKERYL